MNNPLEIDVAYHEAAHSVVAYRAGGAHGKAVSIVPEGDNLGLATEDGYPDLCERDYLEAHLTSCWAGLHADNRRDVEADPSCYDGDMAAAKNLAKILGDHACADDFSERSRSLVDHHWAEIEAVAMELLKQKKLRGEEVEIICDAVAVNGDPSEELAMLRALY